MTEATGEPCDTETTPSPWMNVADAASFARVSHSTLRRAIRRNRLTAYRVSGGAALRLDRADVDAWLRQCPTRADG